MNNNNYAQRFGIGFIIALIFVLTMFQWTFPVDNLKETISSDLDDMEYVSLEQTPTIIENEKKKIVKKVALENAKIKLVEDVKIDFDITLKKKEMAEPIDSMLLGKTKIGTVKKVKKKVVKVHKVLKKEKPDVFVAVEEMPRFGDCKTVGRGRLDDCSTKKLLQFIADHIHYPMLAKESNVEGRVIAQFIIEKDGSVNDVKIIRDLGAGCGQETQRVLEKMPNWKPGYQQGQPVRIKYTIPVVFRLD